MKKLVVLLCATLGCVAAASAQENAACLPRQELALLAAAAPPAATNVAQPNFSSLTLVPRAPAAKTSMPQPAPRFGWREENSWQLSFGYAYVRFRSTPFTVSLNGINTMVAKYLDEQLALEGEVTAAFGREVFPTEHAKYLFYGGGVRWHWPSRQRRLAPWAHGVVGGVHLQPQVASNGRSGFAFELGGGVDWPWKQQVRLRAGADWVRTQLYQDSQNNFQIAAGIVFNF